MFDARKAFRRLNKRIFTYKELRTELGRVRVRNLNNLPAEYGVPDFFKLLWREKWIFEVPPVDGNKSPLLGVVLTQSR